VTLPPIKTLYVPLVGSFIFKRSLDNVRNVRPSLIREGGPYRVIEVINGRLYLVKRATHSTVARKERG